MNQVDYQTYDLLMLNILLLLLLLTYISKKKFNLFLTERRTF